MKSYEWFSRGDIVVVVLASKDQIGKKSYEIVGKAKVTSCDKSSINYSVTYVPWNPVITVAEDLETHECYSNGPYSKYSFFKLKDYIQYLTDEKKKLLEEVKDIDDLIDDLSN